MKKASMELIVLIGFIIGVLITSYFIDYTNGKDRVIHIKNVTNVTGRNVKYLVFAKEGVFQNTDMIGFMKFNSSDLQNEMMGKKECKVRTYGYRIHFLSIYPNIEKIYWCK